MSPVGVTPLAATLNDLATVYLNNRDSLEAVLTQVDTDINGVAIGAVPAAELDAPAITAATATSAAGDAFASLSAPVAGEGAYGTEVPTLAPFGGLMGDALSAGADAVGGPAIAQRLAPAGVQFGADGQAFRVVDMPLTDPAGPERPGAGLPAGSAPAAGWPGTAVSSPQAAASPAPVHARAGRHAERGHHRVVDAASERGTSRQAAFEHPDARPAVPEVPQVPELPPVPHAGLGAGPADVPHVQAVPAAFDGTGAASAANPGIDRIAAVGGQPGGGAPGVPWAGVGVGVGVGYDDVAGRRLPPWLYESEDVWGEEVVVTSPVIGEVPRPNPLRAPRLL
jgi:hypothetical protein